MHVLPKLTQALETIKQDEENAGSRGPYWLTETDYESLYILRQKFTEHKEDEITSVQETLDNIHKEQLELGRSITSFLKGFTPVDSYPLLIQFHRDADRRLIAQLLKGMKSYELVHVMTIVILNRNNWPQSLGADMMTERVIREINHEKQMLAKAEPINVAAWDEAIITELGHTNEDIEPTDLHTQLDTMEIDGRRDKIRSDMGKPAVTHPRPTHQAHKTKAHNKTPQKTSTKTTPPPKKNKATPASPQSNQDMDGTAAFATDTKPKGKGRGPSKNQQGKGKSEVPLSFALHIHSCPPTTSVP